MISLASSSPETEPVPRPSAVRLLAIPLLVFLAWVLETWLLAGYPSLIDHPDPAGYAVYTIVGCIFTGMIVPLLLIRKAFATGAVNMFQTGFGTPRRALLFTTLMAVAVYLSVILFSPFGQDRIAFARAFLLLLPAAAASVMVCWVLAGTHLQAFLRGGGVILPITTGIVVTGILFTAATVALNPAARGQGALFWPVCTGIGAAVLFFAIRDVWATVTAVTAAMVFSGEGLADPAALHLVPPEIFPVSLLAVVALAAIHAYLAMNYTTVLVRVQ